MSQTKSEALRVSFRLRYGGLPSGPGGTFEVVRGPPAAARAPRVATQPRRRAQPRMFVVGCSLPCDPPVGGPSCNGGWYHASMARSVTKAKAQCPYQSRAIKAPGCCQSLRLRPYGFEFVGMGHFWLVDFVDCIERCYLQTFPFLFPSFMPVALFALLPSVTAIA